jgi:surfeit locus 1 family protein
MKPRTLLIALLVLGGTALCVRLGFWQLSRLAEKRALNAALREAIAAPPIEAGGAALPLDRVRGRRVRFTGRFDESRQILLSGRAKGGSPGVHVVTPLRLPMDSTAVLVDRGWLYSPDAAHARPQDHPESGERVVVGIADSIAHAHAGAWLEFERDSVTLWSARALDSDSLAARLPYPVAPYVVRELPGPGVPADPARMEPRPYNEFEHVSYAIQWFLFGSILLFGSALLAWSRRRGHLKLVPPIPRAGGPE